MVTSLRSYQFSESATYDLIIADPPYGIDASGAGFRARSVIHHNYKDDVESARQIIQTILTEGFRITKQRANIFIFCDIDLFPTLKQSASNMGWTVFRRPLIWMKSRVRRSGPVGRPRPPHHNGVYLLCNQRTTRPQCFSHRCFRRPASLQSHTGSRRRKARITL